MASGLSHKAEVSSLGPRPVRRPMGHPRQSASVLVRLQPGAQGPQRCWRHKRKNPQQQKQRGLHRVGCWEGWPAQRSASSDLSLLHVPQSPCGPPRPPLSPSPCQRTLPLPACPQPSPGSCSVSCEALTTRHLRENVLLMCVFLIGPLTGRRAETAVCFIPCSVLIKTYIFTDNCIGCAIVNTQPIWTRLVLNDPMRGTLSIVPILQIGTLRHRTGEELVTQLGSGAPALELPFPTTWARLSRTRRCK